MLEWSMKDTELLPMRYICKALKTNSDTIHSIHRRYDLLPRPIVVRKYIKNLKDPFSRKIMGREVLYSGRTIGYFENIMKLKDEGLSYKDISSRKDVSDEKKLIEILHEVNLAQDPLRKKDELFINFDTLVKHFANKIEGPDITHYVRLSKDAAAVFKDYELVNKEIEKRAYAANFEVKDLMERREHIATRLALFYEMMKVVLRKISEVAGKDSKFKEEVMEILRKGG